MKHYTNIAWLIRGKILDKNAFDEVTSQLMKETIKEEGTCLYWWTLAPSEKVYLDLDCYINEDAVLVHLENWNKYAEQFKACATIDFFVVFGDVSSRVKTALTDLNPIYFNFYGGFWKVNENQTNENIIWMLNGEITDPIKYKESMEVLTKHTFEEEDSRSHWWTVSSDNKHFNVIERYANAEAAMTHLSTWTKYGPLFLSSTAIDSYKVFSPLTEELKKNVSGLKPVLLTFYKGFSK